MRRFFGFVWPWLMAPLFWIVVVVLCVMCSCRSVEYVPVEVVRSDTTYINKIQRDSIHELDSVYIRERGDTVLIRMTRYVYRDRLVRDTVDVSRCDSVVVTRTVERDLSGWERFCVRACGWIIGILAGVIGTVVLINLRKWD